MTYDVIEECPTPTVDELNAKIWGEGFSATIISKEEFDKIWITEIYSGSLTASNFKLKNRHLED